MAHTEKPRSNAWFLLPVLLGIIGGVIAFFFLRNSDPCKAKNCLYLGLVFMIVGIIFNIAVTSSFPGMDSGFNVNV